MMVVVVVVVVVVVCLFEFLTSSSTTRLYRGRAQRLSSGNFKGCHTRYSEEIMASV